MVLVSNFVIVGWCNQVKPRLALTLALELELGLDDPQYH